jgi:hypothetical protein
MEVVAHQAIGVESKGVAILGLGQGHEELLEVGVVAEDAGTVITPVEGVVNQPIANRSWLSSHPHNLAAGGEPGKRKMN